MRASDFAVVCRAASISSSGMLLLSPVAAEPGLPLQLDIHLPQLDSWGQTNAVLVHQTRLDGRLAWGVRFDRLSPFVGTVFRTYVRRSLRGDYVSAPPAEPGEDELANELANEKPSELSVPAATRRSSPGPRQPLDASPPLPDQPALQTRQATEPTRQEDDELPGRQRQRAIARRIRSGELSHPLGQRVTSVVSRRHGGPAREIG